MGLSDAASNLLPFEVSALNEIDFSFPMQS